MKEIKVIELISDKASATMFLTINQMHSIKTIMLSFTADEAVIGLINIIIENNRKCFNEVKDICDNTVIAHNENKDSIPAWHN